MSAFPIRFGAQSNTPASIRSGAQGEVQTIFARNPHATDGAYVKLYTAAEAPVAGSVPVFSAWVPGLSERVLPVFAGAGRWWIVVATEAGAGLSAPSTAFEISLTFSAGG